MTEGIISLKAKADEAAAIWGQIDVLVNNAGEISKIAKFFPYLTRDPSGIAIPNILEEGGYDIPPLNRIDLTQTTTGPPLQVCNSSGTI